VAVEGVRGGQHSDDVRSLWRAVPRLVAKHDCACLEAETRINARGLKRRKARGQRQTARKKQRTLKGQTHDG
jgi:hypothetical protein